MKSKWMRVALSKINYILLVLCNVLLTDDNDLCLLRWMMKLISELLGRCFVKLVHIQLGVFNLLLCVLICHWIHGVGGGGRGTQGGMQVLLSFTWIWPRTSSMIINGVSLFETGENETMGPFYHCFVWRCLLKPALRIFSEMIFNI